MFQVRIHGRGGQGVVTAAELLSVAAFARAGTRRPFPSFGSERTGAPVVAFCRIDDRADPRPGADRRARRADHPGPDAAAPGRRLRRARARRLHPDQLLAQLRRARLGDFAERFRAERLLTVPATDLAREHLGRPLPNAALLGGFAALSGLISLDSVEAAIREKFPGRSPRQRAPPRAGGLRPRRAPSEELAHA